MLPRFSSHVTAMTLAILGASVGPSWSVGAADQLIEACKSSDQACEANIAAFASVVPAGGQRDRVLSTVAADLAEAALLAGTSGRQCSVAQTAILALSQKATATATRNQLTTLAASICGELVRRGPMRSVKVVTVSITLELPKPSWRMRPKAA